MDTASSTDGERNALRLVEAIQALSLARDIDSIIDIVRKAAREMSRADGAAFILRDGDLCYYVDEDAVGPLWKGRRFPLQTCISGWAMLNRRSAAIEDIYLDDRIPHDAYRPTFVKSLAMMPIRTNDPIGAIGIYWATHHVASESEIQLLQALANSTSVAMESVQLNRQLEQRVEERTRQLEDINRELETFSYTVSHDLQAPLRHITSYSELMAKDHPESLDEESRAWLKRIQVSAAHMSELIQSLLRLARFTRLELMEGRVDLSRLAHELVTSLREENPARLVEIEIEDDLQARGDESMLRVVMQNLIGNAWKFSGKREKTKLAIGTHKTPDGSIAYFVKDNGAGFDPQYGSKLFSPFQRLHGTKDFDGMGIGLATVKRIVHRHGGTVWAEAAPDQGATFYFTLKRETPVTSFSAMHDGSKNGRADGAIRNGEH